MARSLERSVLPDGLRVRTLEEALRDGEPQSTLLRVPSGGGTERFAALNAALCPDAVVVDIADRAAPRRAAACRARFRRTRGSAWPTRGW